MVLSSLISLYRRTAHKIATTTRQKSESNLLSTFRYLHLACISLQPQTGCLSMVRKMAPSAKAVLLVDGDVSGGMPASTASVRSIVRLIRASSLLEAEEDRNSENVKNWAAVSLSYPDARRSYGEEARLEFCITAASIASIGLGAYMGFSLKKIQSGRRRSKLSLRMLACFWCLNFGLAAWFLSSIGRQHVSLCWKRFLWPQLSLESCYSYSHHIRQLQPPRPRVRPPSSPSNDCGTCHTHELFLPHTNRALSPILRLPAPLGLLEESHYSLNVAMASILTIPSLIQPQKMSYLGKLRKCNLRVLTFVGCTRM